MTTPPLAPRAVHCTACGTALGTFGTAEAGHLSCHACRTTHWRNPLPVAGVLLVRNGRVLLVRRSASMERAPGRWAYPGGFVESGETADEPAAGDEVEVVRWFAPDEIPWNEIAFPSTAIALRALLAEGLDAPPAHAHVAAPLLDTAPAPHPSHCSVCGGRLRAARPEEPGHARCTACGSPHWRNPATTVSLLVVRNGRVLLGRRTVRGRPGFGMWAGPAGYIEPGESAEEAATRELFEETRIRARVTGIVTVHSSHTHVEVSYFGESADQPEPTREMSAVRWFGAGDMPWLDAFDTCGDSVRRLIATGLGR